MMALVGPAALVPAVMLWKFRLLRLIVALRPLSAVPVFVVKVFGMDPVVRLSVPPVFAPGPGPTALKAVPLAVVIVRLLKLKVLPVLVPVRLIPLAPTVPVMAMSCMVAPVVMLLPVIAVPPDGLIAKYSTRLAPPSVTTVALLLSTGVVLAGKVSVWLFGASVMPASVSAVPLLTSWPPMG